MIRKKKDILSKILIAQQTHKNLIKVQLQKQQIGILQFLWKEGYIYGYKKSNKFSYFIFLKQNTKSKVLFKNTKFKNQVFDKSELCSLVMREKNYVYILSINNQIFSQKDCKKFGLGGRLFFQV